MTEDFIYGLFIGKTDVQCMEFLLSNARVYDKEDLCAGLRILIKRIKQRAIDADKDFKAAVEKAVALQRAMEYKVPEPQKKEPDREITPPRGKEDKDEPLPKVARRGRPGPKRKS